MKKLTSIIAIAFLMTLGFNAVAQESGNTANASANASVTVILPIDIDFVRDLRFGTIASSATAGTITIAATDGAVPAYSVTEMKTTLSPTGSAQFNIHGEGDASFDLDIPTTITLGTGVNAMTVTTSNSLSAEEDRVLDADGDAVLFVGGVLEVNDNQPVGVYTAPFTVTVSYE